MNVTVYPDEISSLKVKEKEAILMLIPYAQWKLKKVIKKFERNLEHAKIKERFCEKVFNTTK